MNQPPHKWTARILIGLGVLFTVLAIFAVWAERQALDTDDWVETSSELLEDDEIQARLTDFLVEELFTNVDVEELVSEQLPPEAAPLAGPATGALRQAATEITSRALDSPLVQSAWQDANRAAHETLIAIVEDEGELVETAGGTVTLQLRPIVEQIGERLGIGADVADKLPEDAAELEILQSDELAAAQDIASLIRGLAIVFSVLAIGSFALAIYLARDRRRLEVLWTGLGFVAAGIIVYALRSVVGGGVVDSLAETEAAKPAVENAWSISTSLMTSIANTVIIWGILFVIGSWIASPTKSGAAVREALAPILRERPGVVYGLVFLVFLIDLATSPSLGLRTLITLLLLYGLAAFGVEALRRITVEEFPDAEIGDTWHRFRDWAQGLADRRKREPGVESAAVEDARLAQLERVSRLRQEGVLSDEEAQAEKARILGED